MLAKIEQQFNAAFYGTISVRDIEPNFTKQFPNVCFVLKDVVVRDTQWVLHHHDLLQVKNVFAKACLWSLLFGKLDIDKLILINGDLYFFEDEYHRSNKSVFEKKRPQQNAGSNFNIKEIVLENFNFRYVHFHRKKDFDFHIDHFLAAITSSDNLRHFDTRGTVLVRQCCFNTDKGSFLKNQKTQFQLNYAYDVAQQTLSFQKQQVRLQSNLLNFNALFQLKESENYFRLDVVIKSLNYKEALACLSPNIQKRLNSFSLKKSISLSLHLRGKLKDQPKPKIEMNGLVRDNEQITPFGTFFSCNYQFHFNNGRDTLFGDEYTTIRLTKLSAKYEGLNFRADTTVIFNIKSPILKTNIQAQFPITKLNNVFGKETFKFGKGEAKLNISYDGVLKTDDVLSAQLSGYIHVRNGEMEYLPRHLLFNHCDIAVALKGQNIILEHSVLHTPKSTIWISANAPDFLKLYQNHPEQILINAFVTSNFIDLNEFQSFLHRRTVEEKNKGRVNRSMTNHIDKALDASTTNLNIDFVRLVYKKFEASNLKGSMSLLPKSIHFNHVRFKHSDGNVELSGGLAETEPELSTFYINSSIHNASIEKLLYSFGNFGQTTFSPENISGEISLFSNIEGRFGKNAQFVLGSLKGTASFEINHAVLTNFKPIEKIGRYAFRKKRLSKVHFGQLKNTLNIKANEIFIPPMFISSDLISLKINGIYNLDKGTDLNLEIPLFRQDKEQLNQYLNSDSKSYRLYVHAKDDEMGMLQYSWNLSNKEVAAARAERKKIKGKRKLLHQ
ncbi:MAG: AsmA-like C-terminal region-containing protein [Phycisphaerales bacterium]|nr:AsmA-like C-terminal region-containing protein [Phycisphaerales bacterium]